MESLAYHFSTEPYRLEPAEKQSLILEELGKLTRFHAEHCRPYACVMDSLFPDWREPAARLADLPYLPVRLFKMMDLQSVPDSDIVRRMTSSGTTSQQVSRIALDLATATNQTRALASIMTSILGPKRLPMLIIDTESVLRKPTALSARGAGLLGFSNFGRDHCYVLDENMNLQLDRLEQFVNKHGSGPVLIFGFTFMVWQHFCQELRRRGVRLELNQGILFHGGGWKKLRDEAVGTETFRRALLELCGIRRVHNFYGMVEQVGSIFIECEEGHLHAPDFAEVIVRDHRHWQPVPPGTTGVIQVLSLLPHSYPGHSLLTEDLGVLTGKDGCACGRRGTHFRIEGRIPAAELRGCSDTFVARPAAEVL